MSQPAKFRYPGIYYFGIEQKDLFFGRERDISKLLTLISVEEQVLLYAKSGVGKTSLLNAGVFPNLDPDEYAVVPVRFFAYSEGLQESPAHKLKAALNAAARSAEERPSPLLDALTKEHGETVWSAAKHLQLSFEKPKTLLLAFDQFEELFSYPEDQIEDFKQQYYDLLKVDMPPEWIKSLGALRRENKELVTRTALSQLKQKSSVKPIYSIRTDRLALLDRLTDKFRKIRSVFYELQPLSNKDARAAIEEPAKAEGNFDTPPFRFEEAALRKILNYLGTDRKGNPVQIESTQLQIICLRIEREARKGGKSVITEADIPDLKNVFLDFYRSALDRIGSEKERGKAAKLIEDELIRSGQRISLDETICKETLSQEALDTLVDARLLRRTPNSVGNLSYEVAHDSLVQPISEEAEKRYQREEEERAEAERQKELAEAKHKAEEQEKERLKTKKQLRITRSLLFVALAAVVAAAFFFYDAKRNLKAVKLYSKRADDARYKSIREEVNAKKVLVSVLDLKISETKKSIGVFEQSQEIEIVEAYKQISDSLVVEREKILTTIERRSKVLKDAPKEAR